MFRLTPESPKRWQQLMTIHSPNFRERSNRDLSARYRDLNARRHGKEDSLWKRSSWILALRLRWYLAGEGEKPFWYDSFMKSKIVRGGVECV